MRPSRLPEGRKQRHPLKTGRESTFDLKTGPAGESAMEETDCRSPTMRHLTDSELGETGVLRLVFLGESR